MTEQILSFEIRGPSSPPLGKPTTEFDEVFGSLHLTVLVGDVDLLRMTSEGDDAPGSTLDDCDGGDTTIL